MLCVAHAGAVNTPRYELASLIGSTLLPIVIVMLACTNADEPPAAGTDAATEQSPRDASMDAAVRSDAKITGFDACVQQTQFLEAHRTCSTEEECVIVGSCSDGFGFEAVHVSVRAEAQALSDNAACNRKIDGPNFNARCERNKCVARPNGRWCGGPSRDAGGGGCPAGTELYRTDCTSNPPLPAPACERRCSAPGDRTCGDAGCVQVQASAVAGVYGDACGDILEFWFCRPGP